MNKRLLFIRILSLAVLLVIVGILVFSVLEGERITASNVLTAAAPLLVFIGTFVPDVSPKEKRKFAQMAEPFMGRAFDGHPKEKKQFIRAFTFWQKDKIAEAVSALARLYKATDSTEIKARARFLAGRCFQEAEEYAWAAELYEEALDLEPDMAMAWSNLATTYDNLGEEPQTMIRCLENAVFYEPDYEIAYGKLGMYYNMTGEFDKSERVFCTAIRLNPRQPVYHANLSWALVSAGKLDEAEKEYRQALAYGYTDKGLGEMLVDARAAGGIKAESTCEA